MAWPLFVAPGTDVYFPVFALHDWRDRYKRHDYTAVKFQCLAVARKRTTTITISRKRPMQLDYSVPVGPDCCGFSGPLTSSRFNHLRVLCYESFLDDFHKQLAYGNVWRR